MNAFYSNPKSDAKRTLSAIIIISPLPDVMRRTYYR